MEQSPNWERRKDLPLRQDGGGYHVGWPFNEGWPSDPYVQYVIVPAWGGQYTAHIDTSRQYAAEGLRWVLDEPDGRRPNSLTVQLVAAWRRDK